MIIATQIFFTINSPYPCRAQVLRIRCCAENAAVDIVVAQSQIMNDFLHLRNIFVHVFQLLFQKRNLSFLIALDRTFEKGIKHCDACKGDDRDNADPLHGD